MTMLGFVRHGSTEWNQLGKLQGQLDTDLTEVGREEARKLGRRLAEEQWDGIICSDLKRASETAQILGEESGIPLLHQDRRLRERSYGEAEGTTAEEREARWGIDWKKLDIGQETDQKLWARWIELEQELLQAYPDGKLLLVSHGGFIVQILRELKMEPESFLKNTSLTILLRGEAGWELELYNCLAHLQNE
ncbi:histidine phosphatase family protein [Paenibacillus ferrarius]|uniref:histidine phosphatase family protein n=1 Tax=Paenibacillus ferrarius TaxID=1469647 RepID=UPI003D27A91E